MFRPSSIKLNHNWKCPNCNSGSATSITTTQQYLNGTINPNGLATTYSFAYGTSTDYDNVEFSIIELTGSDPQPVSANISGLIPNTEYHFELSAVNDAGDRFWRRCYIYDSL